MDPMTAVIDDDDDETRPRVLSNLQVLGYIARHWLQEPVRFGLAWVLIMAGAACDLTMTVATRALINAGSDPARVTAAAWTAWALLSGLYFTFFMIRPSTFPLMNGFYSRIMARIVPEGF